MSSVVGDHIGSYCPWCREGQRCPEMAWRHRKRVRIARIVAALLLIAGLAGLSVALTAPARASVTRDAASVSASLSDAHSAQTRAQTRSVSLSDARTASSASVALSTDARAQTLSASRMTVRVRAYSALKWAEGKAGCWYSWGGTSCSRGFDCSGLVMAAYAREGYSLPHSTYSMLSSGRIYRIPASQRRQGDLAFYGSGHVEFVTLRGTFGALDPGTRVGWHRPSAWWHPTMYYRIRY